MSSAIIAGATGAVGHAVLRQLDSGSDYSAIHTLGRRAPAVTSPRIHSHIVDYEHLDALAIGTLGEAIGDSPVDVYCTLGTTIAQAGSKPAFRSVDFDYVVATAQLAVRLNARSLNVVSAIGANRHSSAFYSRVKGETEEALRALPLRSLNVFRPALLHGERESFRLGETVAYYVLSPLSPLLCGKLAKYRPVAVERVAAAMVRAALSESTGLRIIESDEIQQLSG